MKLVRRVAFVVTLFAVAAAVLWGPTYLRGASFVVRAAGMDGWVAHALAGRSGAWRAGDVMTIPTRHGPIPARLYQPDGASRRAVLLTPGVHAMGVDEPRLKGLAADLARSGLTVLTVALPDLVHYRFAPQSVDEIEDAAGWLAGRSDLAPDGRVGLMGISFAGGLSVVAAGRPSLRNHVAYVFSFGGHGDLPRVLRYLCSGLEPRLPGTSAQEPPHFRAPHDYGVAVILLGVADRVVPPDQVDALRAGIETYLTASQLTLVDMTKAKAVYEESKRLAEALPEPARDLMRMVNERDTKDLGARLFPVVDRDVPYPPSLSPDQSPPPSAPVFLLHGADDTVVPAVETVLLADHLRQAGVEVHPLLSALITHAEVNKTAAASETFKLVAFWGNLLSR